jgi:glycosyl transferase, family 25
MLQIFDEMSHVTSPVRSLVLASEVANESAAADSRASHGSDSGGLRALREYFDAVYVVSIERNRERRALLEADLGGALPLVYLPGVDGSRLTESELSAEYDDRAANVRYGRSLSPGQIGCALSHRRVYQDLLDRGHRRVLVLEDDAMPVGEGLRSAGAALEQLPQDWDFLYLFTLRGSETRWLDWKVRYVYPALNATRLRRYDLNRIRTTHSRPFTSNLRVAGQHWFALAYAVSDRAAARMLSIQTPIRTVADDVTRMICETADMKSFLTVPNLFIPRPDVDSTIWNRPARSRAAR